jgi:hypothetical protein
MAYEEAAAARKVIGVENHAGVTSTCRLTSKACKCTSIYCHYPLPRRREIGWIPLISFLEINLVLHSQRDIKTTNHPETDVEGLIFSRTRYMG